MRPAPQSFKALSALRFGPFVLLVALAVTLAGDLRAQTFTVLHTFTGPDGAALNAGLTMDRAGNLYGTTLYGGAHSNGEVFRLQRVGDNWIFNILYSFQGGTDGAHPWGSKLVFGPDGSLYGTTYAGGNGGCGSQNFGCGTVFRLRPPVTFCSAALCSWTETVLYRFSGGEDGAAPHAGVAFDRAGNMYGTTFAGGINCGGVGCGVVYQLTPSGNSWTYNRIHAFTGGEDGNQPHSTVTFDAAGNFYGTTVAGGATGNGTVYQFQNTGSGWVENVIYSFTAGADGRAPTADVLVDPSGTLYSVASHGGQLSDLSTAGLAVTNWRPPLPPVNGTAFALVPSGGSYAFNLLYSFTLDNLGGEEPYYGLIMDSAGNLYGAATGGGIPPQYDGAAYKLTPGSPQWTYTSLHNFTGGADGLDPECVLVMDSSGNLYGTTLVGGTVWQITP